jgi:hypothetical protein
VTRHPRFPPPSSKDLQAELSHLYAAALRVGLNVLAAILIGMIAVTLLFYRWFSAHEKSHYLVIGALLIGFALMAVGMNWVVTSWLEKKVGTVFEDHLWEASFAQERKVRSDTPESTMWLNSLLSGVWPLINPDLFTSIADTLEDVMQASLNPKVVRMVQVADLGQGAVAPRILGARWLPMGAAGQSVSVGGQIESKKENEQNDRKVPGEGQTSKTDQDDTGDEDAKNKDFSEPKEEDEQAVSEGLQAESGDFTNMEIMFSYRTQPKGDGMKEKSKGAHLVLIFYLPGNIPLPIYVSLRGIVGRMRLRMQLSPDPPFVNLCTMTLLGQPKADISCVPLTRKFMNLMDLPLISSFVQSSIDAALSEYVAPRSLTLDLKQMLQGDDFKKNTSSRGMVAVNIKRAYDFKEADSGLMSMGEASSDAYVSVGWAKFGKPLWSTRVILKDMEPVWEEWAYILVGPEELNADESLRVQLWDSDRTSADDDLGRIEISLKDLMNKTAGKMYDRSDGFLAMDADEKMPGKLDWAVGFFDKLQITDDQFQSQTFDPEVRNMKQLDHKVAKDAEHKLREADRDITDEADQQKAQDFEEHANDLICSAPPPRDYPSGILSIQIHEVTGLELAKLNKDRNSEGDDYNDSYQTSDDLPSGYATIVLNGRPVYMTRTKPKNAKPFFNATTERFVRDWRNSELIVSVRDSRTNENDPLLGFVYLPLEQVFSKRSQINSTYPLSGGAGFGRMRISLMFRAVDVKLPKELLGWDYGTLELTGPVKCDGLPNNLSGLRITVKSNYGKGKLHAQQGNEWKAKKDRLIRLGVSSRYSANVVFEFRSNASIKNKTAAFAVLWLRDIPDDEDQDVQLTVWNPVGKNFERAKANYLTECGEKAGTMTVPLKFYSGLSEYHKQLAKKRPEMGQVMEVLDAASDQKEKQTEMPDDGADGGSSSSSSSSDDDDDNDEDLEKDGSRGPISDIREYQKHHKVLHRKQRGVMQWKAARKGNWLKTKVDHSVEKMKSGMFAHHDREPGVETEV